MRTMCYTQWEQSFEQQIKITQEHKWPNEIIFIVLYIHMGFQKEEGL